MDRRFRVPAPESIWARVSLFLRDIAYPPVCSGCGERGVWLCARCHDRVPELAAVPWCCRRCGIPVVGRRCGCALLHPKITRAVSAYPYADWIENAVHGVKYEGEKDRAAFLGVALAASSAASLLTAADVVVPVPMYAGRERERGYNQAYLMANQACAAIGRNAPQAVLLQHEERRSQVGLNARERQTNVRGSFSVDPDIDLRMGLRIVIVDDVRTTGSTLTACVEALRPIRPSRVDVVTLAAELSHEVRERIGLQVDR